MKKRLLVLVGRQRSGTTALAETLSAGPVVHSLGEIFHAISHDYLPQRIEHLHLKPDQNYFSFKKRMVEGDASLAIPLPDHQDLLFEKYVDYLEGASEKPWLLLDIKYNSWLNFEPAFSTIGRTPYLLHLLSKRGASFVHVKRLDTFGRYCSEQLALAQGAWHSPLGSGRTTFAPINIDPVAALRDMRETVRQTELFDGLLSNCRSRIDLEYETLYQEAGLSPDARRRLDSLFGGNCGAAETVPLQKVSPPLDEMVANGVEVIDFFRQTEFAESVSKALKRHAAPARNGRKRSLREGQDKRAVSDGSANTKNWFLTNVAKGAAAREAVANDIREDDNMYNAPLVMGIDAALQEPANLHLDDKLRRTGNNTGNLIFSESVFDLVQNGRRAHYRADEGALEGRDCVVIAAANWLNPHVDFGFLADQLEKTDLPVVIIGLGAQSSLGQEMPKIKDGTRRLVNIAAERSESISVRGEFTAEVLNHIGVKNVAVTGCPSFMLCGPQGPKMREVDTVTPGDCVVHSTRHLFNFSQQDGVHNYLYREAFRSGMELVFQSELADMYFALGRTNNEEVISAARKVLEKAYNVSNFSELDRYLQSKTHVFFSIQDWISYLQTKKFCFGTRIHGSVVSILAGTSSLLIVHDSRTLEMAQHMHIPYVLSSEIDQSQPLAANDLVAKASDWDYSKNYPLYYRNFLDFFSRNKIRVSQMFLEERAPAA